MVIAAVGAVLVQLKGDRVNKVTLAASLRS
jgi:hypothetical protein